MKFVVNQGVLYNRVKSAQAAINMGGLGVAFVSESQIDSSIRLVADKDNGSLTLITANRDGTCFDAVIPASVEDSGSIHVKADLLSSILGNFPTGDLDVESDNGAFVTLKSGSTEVSLDLVNDGESSGGAREFTAIGTPDAYFESDLEDLTTACSIASHAATTKVDTSSSFVFVVSNVENGQGVQVISGSERVITSFDDLVADKSGEVSAAFAPRNIAGVIRAAESVDDSSRVKIMTYQPNGSKGNPVIEVNILDDNSVPLLRYSFRTSPIAKPEAASQLSRFTNPSKNAKWLFRGGIIISPKDFEMEMSTADSVINATSGSANDMSERRIVVSCGEGDDDALIESSSKRYHTRMAVENASGSFNMTIVWTPTLSKIIKNIAATTDKIAISLLDAGQNSKSGRKMVLCYITEASKDFDFPEPGQPFNGESFDPRWGMTVSTTSA